MPWAIELSGEHETLPRAEATALVELEGARVVDAGLDRVLLVEGPLDPARFADRAALAWRVVEVAARTPVDVDAIVDAADAVELDGSSFAVRCSRLEASLDPGLPPEIERQLGAALEGQARVDLDQPACTVRVLLDREAVVGVERARVDRSAFEARHVEARPYFSPVSLHPRLARALVNLAGVAPGARVWDPFCGTGGVALEAALVGAETIASDIDPEMLEGTRETLAHFGVEADLVEGDVAKVAPEVGTVEAVVTDPPYGRASTTNREDLAALYDRFLGAAVQVLEPGGRLACILPDPAIAQRAPASLERVQQHAWYVHGSLTRHVTVFQRRGAH